jgi:methyl-accepting chemotaxis protein
MATPKDLNIQQKKLNELQRAIKATNDQIKALAVSMKALEFGGDVAEVTKFLKGAKDISNIKFNNITQLSKQWGVTEDTVQKVKRAFDATNNSSERQLRNIIEQSKQGKDLLNTIEQQTDQYQEQHDLIQDTSKELDRVLSISEQLEASLGEISRSQFDTLNLTSQLGDQFNRLAISSDVIGLQGLSSDAIQAAWAELENNQIGISVDVSEFDELESQLEDFITSAGQSFEDLVSGDFFPIESGDVDTLRDQIVKLDERYNQLILNLESNKGSIAESISGMLPELKSVNVEVEDINKLLEHMYEVGSKGESLIDPAELGVIESKLSGLDDIVRTKLINSLTVGSAKFSEINDQVGTIVNRMGAANFNMNKVNLLAGSTGNMFQGVRESADGLVSSIQSVADVLPSWAQSLLGVDRGMAQFKNSVNSTLSQLADDLANGTSRTKALATAVGSLGKSFYAALGPIGLIIVAVTAIYNLLTGVESAVSGISKEFSVSRAKAAEIYKTSLMMTTSLGNQLVTQQDITESMKAFSEVYGRNMDLSKQSNQELVKFATHMGKNYGMATGEVVKLTEQFKQLGADQEQAKGLTAYLAKAGELSGIPFDTLAKDLVDAGDMLYTRFKGMPKLAAKAVVEIRRMGMSMKQVGAAMDKALDIGGFMQDMAELQVMTSGSADLSKFFDMRFSGADPADMAKEIATQYDGMVASGEANEFTMRKFAESVGMSVEDLEKGRKIRELSSQLTAEEAATLQKHLGSLSDEELKNGAIAAEKAKALQATDRMNVAFSKIKDTLTSALLPVIEVISGLISDLSPLLGFVMIPIKLIGTLLKALKPVLEGIMWPFKIIGNIVQYIAELLDSWFNPIDRAADSVNGVSSGLGNVLSIIGKVAGGAIGLFAIFKGFGFVKNIFSGIGSSITGMWDTAKGAFSSMKDGMTQLFSKDGGSIMDRVKSVFSSKPKSAKDLASSVTGPTSGDSVTGSVDSKGLQELTEASKQIDGKLGDTLKNFLEKLAEGMKAVSSGEVETGSNNLSTASSGLSVLGKSSDSINKLADVDGEKLAKVLEGMGEGLTSMSPSEVKSGSKNLMIAAIGFLIMNVGVGGAKKIQDLDGDKLSESLGGMAEGLESMGTGKVTGGSANLIAASIGFLLFMPGAVGAWMIQKLVDGEKLKTSLEGMATGLEAMGNGKAIAGALGLVLASIGFIAMIPGAIGMVALGLAAPLAAAGLAVLTPALIAFGTAMMSGVGLIGLLAFVGAAIGLAYALKVAAPGIAAFGVVVQAFGTVVTAIFDGLATLVTAAAAAFVTLVEGISGLDPLQLMGAAAGIGAIGLALAAFGGGSLISGIGSGLGKLFGGDPIKKFERFAALADPLKIVADSIQIIGSSISELNSALSGFDSDKLKEVAESMADLQTVSTGELFKSAITGIINTIAPVKEIQPSQVTTPQVTATQTTTPQVTAPVSPDSIGATASTSGPGEINTGKLEQTMQQLVAALNRYANTPVVVKIGDMELRSLNKTLKSYNNVS